MTLVDRTPPYHPSPLAAEIIHQPPEELSGLDKLSHVAPLKPGGADTGVSGSGNGSQFISGGSGGNAGDASVSDGPSGSVASSRQTGGGGSAGTTAASGGTASQGGYSWGSRPATTKNANGLNHATNARPSHANPSPPPGHDDLPRWSEKVDAVMEAMDDVNLGMEAIRVFNGQIIHRTCSRVLNLALKHFPDVGGIVLSKRLKTIIGMVEAGEEYGLGPDILLGFGVQVAENWNQIHAEYRSADPGLIKAGKIGRKLATCYERTFWGCTNTIEHDLLFSASGYAMLFDLARYRSFIKASDSSAAHYLKDTKKVVDMHFNFVTDADNQWLLIKLTAHAAERRAQVLASKLSAKHNPMGERSTFGRM